MMVAYNRSFLRPSTNFVAATLQATRKWNGTLKILKDKKPSARSF